VEFTVSLWGGEQAGKFAWCPWARHL